MTMLPSKFAVLERFAGKWCLPTETLRRRERSNSSIEELDEFYAAMLANLDEIMEFLNGYELDNLAPPEQNLFFLCLSLAEIATAVERFRAPDVPLGYDASRFRRVHVPNQTPQHSPV